MKIGFDIHGVLDKHPIFAELTKLLVANGHEVHILTGKRVKDGALKEAEDVGAYHTHFFSIADYYDEKGQILWNDENGRPHMDSYLWDKTKAEYCKRNQIDLHFDDSPVYGQYFKDETVYARIGQKL